MAPRAVVRFVENEKCNLFDVHEAVDQCIQEHLMSADKNSCFSGRRPTCFAHSTDRSRHYQREVCSEKMGAEWR